MVDFFPLQSLWTSSSTRLANRKYEILFFLLLSHLKSTLFLNVGRLNQFIYGRFFSLLLLLIFSTGYLLLLDLAKCMRMWINLTMLEWSDEEIPVDVYWRRRRRRRKLTHRVRVYELGFWIVCAQCAQYLHI